MRRPGAFELYIIHSLIIDSVLKGFVGVYLAGYILEVTGGSWVAVFNVTAAINAIGLAVFVAFGSGNPIV